MEGWFSLLFGFIASVLSLILSLPPIVFSFLNLVLKIHLAIQGARIVIQIVNYVRNVQNWPRYGSNDDPAPQLSPDLYAERNLLDGDNVSNWSSSLGGTQFCILDQKPEEVPFPALKPSNQSAPRADMEASTPTPSVVPWDGKISWAFAGESVFNSQAEQVHAIMNYKNHISRECQADGSLVLHGLKYVPAPMSTDAYRTVKIDLFDKLLDINHILYHLYFYEVYSATFAKTMDLTGHNTTIVIFIHQTDAMAFVKTHKDGLKIGPYVAKASLINTPTYPIPNQLYRNIMECGYSRRLIVCDNRCLLKEQLETFFKASPCRGYIETVKTCAAEKGVFVQFHNVKMAVFAFDLLKHSPTFGNSLVEFRGVPIRGPPKQPWSSQSASENGEW